MEDLDCANCAAKMEDAIRKIEGVTYVSISFMAQRMTLEANDAVFDEVLKKAQKAIKKVEPDFKLTGKAKGYLAMVVFCALVLLVVVFVRIVPCTPVGIIRVGVCIYACLICTMLVMALLQRSSIYALGAVLFVFSDFILAWHKFVGPVPYRHYLVLVTYFLAQWLLFVRSTPYRITNLRLFRF